MQMTRKNMQHGLTLLELIVVISISSLLLASVFPALQTFVRNQRKTTEVNALIGALNYTRNEAVRQRRSLYLCAGSVVDGCQDDSFWRADWLLMSGLSTSQAGEPLYVFARSNNFFWRWRGAGGNPFIRFKADGSAAGSNGTFTLCHQKEALYQVVVNFAGRIRSQVAATNARCD